MRLIIEHIWAGWATVGGKKYYFKSRFEQQWAERLELLKQCKIIKDWWYEPDIFWFEEIKRGVRSYTPDFKFIQDDEVAYYECKGAISQKDCTKYRRMAKYYPNIKIILVMQRISQGNSKSARRQRILVEQASKYVKRIIEYKSIK